MKRIFDLIMLIAITLANIINAQNKNSLIKIDEEGISIKSIDIKAKVIGDIGITIYTIEVFNNLDKMLSGELQFPLSSQQSVIGYSLDIEGQLRRAVSVNKTKGQTTYQDRVSKAIDPGLLEKTAGNNFKTHIYPIPAKGSRIIAIEILDSFIWKEGGFEWKAILDFKEKIDKQSIHIDFIGFSENLKLQNSSSFELKNKDGIISLTSHSTKNVAIKVIPQKKHFSFYQQHKDEYFYYSSVTTPIINKAKTTPESINILWDCSRSRKGLVSKEIEFLKALAKKIKALDINVILFNTSIVEEKKIKIRDGKTKKLEKFLTAIKYDGATQYGCIDNLPNASINILCSDGIGNFGNNIFKNTLTPTYTITSQTSINSSKLKVIARDNAGIYIHLKEQSITSSIALILNTATTFSGYLEKSIKEHYPKINAKIPSTQFRSMARGIASKTLTPKFKVNHTSQQPLTPIYIEKNIIDLRRMFAIEKVRELSLYPKENKEQLRYLGLKYHLVTDYTSLIVLETLDDYINNQILPPNEDWQKIYKDNLQLSKIQKQLNILETKTDQAEELEQLLEWQFPKKKKDIAIKFKKIQDVFYDDEEQLEEEYDKIEDILDSINSLNIPRSLSVIHDESLREPRRYNGSSSSYESDIADAIITISTTLQHETGMYLVTGIIVAKDDMQPFPGVNIILRGTAKGTVTDFDGNFSIEVPVHSFLEYSYIGYKTLQKEIRAGKYQENFASDVSHLEEVAVVGYGQATRMHTMLYKNPGDFLINAPSTNDYQVFKYDSKLFIKKNENHAILGENPVVFEDYEDDDFNDIDWEYGKDEFEDINWKDVFSLEIIPPSAATKLAGDVGKDGIIFMYTKDYVEDDLITIPININKHVVHRLSKKAWSNIPPTLQAIRKHGPKKRYKKYLEITEKEKQTVGFYMVAGSLFTEDAPETSLKIWSNIAEIQLDNQENIRTLAYQLRSIDKYEEAIPFFEKILALRPDQPIAYRDLAVTYALNKNYSKAVEILENALDGDWIERNADPYDYVEVMNTLYNDYNSILKSNNINASNEYLISADLRVVLTWTSNDTDIDLHLITPSGKDFYYKNDESDTIRYNTDITDGFGPEEILVKTADKGTYTILVDFYADRKQTINGPVGLTIEAYKYFGTDKEERTEKVLTLTKEADNVLGTTIKF